MAIFIDPDGLDWIPLLFLLAVYAYILFTASNMISDGSELLLLIKSVAGIVGSVVLPVLGAVPDGAIVLFSGLGPGAQQQLSVGVGALAGSTIMLLTLPWLLSVVAGRVDCDSTGNPGYHSPPRLAAANRWSLTTGVLATDAVKSSANIMMLTAVSFIIIQVSAERCGGVGTVPGWGITGTLHRASTGACLCRKLQQNSHRGGVCQAQGRHQVVRLDWLDPLRRLLRVVPVEAGASHCLHTALFGPGALVFTTTRLCERVIGAHR